MDGLYYTYANYLKNKYHEKVYKLPISLPLTCPNRDGKVGLLGCTFCSEKGTAFESLENTMSISEQLQKNKAYIGRRYGAKKFIAYFQNYTNTYMPILDFERALNEAYIDDTIVEIAVSTRPDAIGDEYLACMKRVEKYLGIPISIELGLQTTNEESLIKINRGHNCQTYIDAVKRIKTYGFEITTHLIMNLPWDTLDDIHDMATLMNELNMNVVKLHSLYIVKGTVMANEYINNEWEMCSMEDYVKRVSLFLGHLDASIAVARLLARAPKEETLFCNWNTSWWKIHDAIMAHMTIHGISQGNLIKSEG